MRERRFDRWLRGHVVTAVVGVALFSVAWAAPLVDPDFPLHLAVGEWIARHHAVPFAEPFAWTRTGAPYYAYSWLAQLTFFEVDRAFGSAGLHILAGMITAAAYVAIIALGKAARWRSDVTAFVALGNALIMLMFAPSLRPQMLLFVAVPIVWIGAAMLARAQTSPDERRALVVALIGSILAANTHIFFAVTVAPGIVLASGTERAILRRAAMLVAVVGAGWLFSPYAFDWWHAFRLYFAPNAFLGPGAPIAELKPGFIGFPILGMLLAAVPWLAVPHTAPRVRLPYALLWLAGVATFAVAAKGMILWWLVCIPLAAAAAETWPSGSSEILRRAPAVATLVLCAFLGLPLMLDPRIRELRAREGDVINRQLPSTVAPLADTLSAHLLPTARGRILTVFNYGSFLTWRLPQLSSSIDSRSIFPDSAAYADALGNVVIPKGVVAPYTSSDLAIVPMDKPIASVLDTAIGWRRVAVTDSTATYPKRSGLWVRETWWTQAARP